MSSNENKKNDTLEYKTRIYPELLKYKEFFSIAVTIYFNYVLSENNVLDYTSDSSKIFVRLKIESEPTHYKELIDLIENELNGRFLNNEEFQEHKKISQSVLINNIMSVLINNEGYN